MFYLEVENGVEAASPLVVDSCTYDNDKVHHRVRCIDDHSPEQTGMAPCIGSRRG